MNRTTSYAKARQNLKSLCDAVCAESRPFLIERRKGGNVVIISEDDFSSLEETAYLLASPKNAQRLLEALGRSNKRKKTFQNITKLKDEIGI